MVLPESMAQQKQGQLQCWTQVAACTTLRQLPRKATLTDVSGQGAVALFLQIQVRRHESGLGFDLVGGWHKPLETLPSAAARPKFHPPWNLVLRHWAKSQAVKVVHRGTPQQEPELRALVVAD